MTSIALNNALTGLRVSQQSLEVLSQNIANANNENYTRQSASQSALNLGNEIGSGVNIDSIDRQINEYISKTIVTTNSNVSRANVISDYYTQLQVFMGQPGKSNSIDTYVNNFFNAMSQLAVTPETSSLKINAVAAGQNLASQISSLANDVENLRFDADHDLKQAVNSVNQSLNNIYNLNAAILSAKSNNASVNGLKDSLDAELKNISKMMDISYRTEQGGTVSINTNSGVQLLGVGTLTQLEYTPATSIDDFKNNIPSSAIKIYQVDSTGKHTGTGIPLVNAGLGDEVTTSLTGGKIFGLLKIRDKSMPDVLKQLDTIAKSIVDSVNAVHNNGSGYPPLQTLTGSTLVDPTSYHQWGGNVMIAALDSSGKPIASPYASDGSNGNGYAPLNIDLAALNSGTGAGNPTFQTIINEINHYYGAPQPRVGMADISNVELRVDSDAITAGSGTFKFSLDLSNLSANSSTFRVTSAGVSGGAVVTPNLNDVAVAGGATKNTAGTLDFSVNMAAAAAGPYTVTLNVQTTNSDGTVSSGVITYTLANAASGLRNHQYAPATASGSAAIENPTTNQAMLQAKLVDANGNEVAKDPTTGNYTASGYLQITGVNSSNRVAISELNSTELGDASYTPSANATNFGFSHYFGLNNFFVNNGQTGGSALNMAVTSKVANNPQRVSIGTLSLSNQPNDAAKKRYTYEVGSGSNQSIESLSSLSHQSFKFGTAGGLPETTLSFSDYAAQIIGDSASKTAGAANDLTQQQLVNQGFIDKDKSVRGVNVDEEMANTILFQNAYSANARVITVTKQLFEDLLQAFV